MGPEIFAMIGQLRRPYSFPSKRIANDATSIVFMQERVFGSRVYRRQNVGGIMSSVRTQLHRKIAAPEGWTN